MHGLEFVKHLYKSKVIDTFVTESQKFTSNEVNEFIANEFKINFKQKCFSVLVTY